MRILALIRQVLDAEESLNIAGDAVDLTGRKLVMDTMDEYGVEEAVRSRKRSQNVRAPRLSRWDVHSARTC